MDMGISAGFSNAQQINQMVTRIGQIQQSNADKTLQVIQAVNQKTSDATLRVMTNAMETKAQSTDGKGRIVDVLA